MSRFAALRNVKVEADTETAPAATTPPPQPPRPTVAKRGSSQYRQFSAYLRADLYRQLKIRVAEREMDLSDAINEAVHEWLNKGREEPVAD